MSPRIYPSRRMLVAVRIAPAGVEQLDSRAARDGVTRSEVIRRAISEYLTRR